MKELY